MPNSEKSKNATTSEETKEDIHKNVLYLLYFVLCIPGIKKGRHSLIKTY